ncbi:hypothetical protein GCM10017764_20460 [Sphingobacterium griseoflavum]|uniref:Uncharacterized protein n=2 Tax=Sphingobacterium griseoflavum TaxID=1474952 RepID=A0ABQ3I0A3_9SPHI|nr:hypothetical protein GCM10017764_20460 [Sphingobacterium griseoflavum]
MRCKKDDYVYESVNRIDGAKVLVTLLPEKTSYTVGDTVSIEGTFLPKDFGMEDFSMIEDSPWVKDFMFFKVGSHDILYDVISIIQNDNFRNESFSSDYLSYSFKRSYRLERAGSFHINHGVENTWNNKDAQGNIIYSALSITILSGKRKPRGYRTDAIMYFTNNDKTFIDIEVVE